MTAVVGSVGVRVKPVVNDFARDTREKLKKLEPKLYRPKTTVRVKDIDVDEKALAAARERIERSLDVNASLRGLDKLDATISKIGRQSQIRLGVGLDEDSIAKLNRDIDRTVKRLTRDVDINLSDRHTRAAFARLTREHERILRTLNRHNDGIKLLSEEETQRVKHRLKEIADELDETAKNRTVRLDINPFTTWASARLAYLSRPRIAEIIPVVPKTAARAAEVALARLSGVRLGGKYISDFTKWLKDIDEKLPKAALAAGSIAAGFAGITATLGGLVAVGNSIVQMSAALLPLPGILTAAALSATVLVRAWKDINDQIPSIKTGLERVGETLSANYWAQARENVSALADDLIPRLDDRMGHLATAMGVHTSVFAAAFQAALANGELETMFNRTIQFWGELTVGADDFASALVHLGIIGTTYLPRLGRWISDLTTRFNRWLDAGIKSGRIFDQIEKGITQVKLLGRAAGHTGGILAGIHKAASNSGFTGLEGLTLTLSRWNKAVNGYKWQTTLVEGFRASREAMRHFGDTFRELGDMLYHNRGIFNDFVVRVSRGSADLLGSVFRGFRQGEFQRSFQAFTTGLAKALKALEPAAAPLTRIIGKILETLGRLAASIAPVITKLITAIEPVLIPLLDIIAAVSEAITPVVGMLADMAGVITSQLGPAIAVLGVVLATAAVAAKIQALATAVGAFITTAGQVGVVTALGQATSRAGTQAGAAAGKVGLLGRAGGALAAGLNPAMLGVAAGVTALAIGFDMVYAGTEKARVSAASWESAIRKGKDGWRDFGLAVGSDMQILDSVLDRTTHKFGALSLSAFAMPEYLGTIVSQFTKIGKESFGAVEGMTALNIGLSNSAAGIKIWGADTAQAMTDLEEFGKALGNVAREDVTQAQKAFSRMLETNKVLPENFNQALTSASGFKDALRDLANYAGVAADDSSLLKYATDDNAAAYLKAKVSAQEAKDALAAYGKSLEGVLGHAAPAVGAFAQLATEWGNLGSRQRDAALSGYAFQDSMEAARAQVEATGLSLDTNTQSGRDNMRMLYDLASATNAHAEANINSGVSVKDVATKYAAQRDEIIALAAAAGLSDDELAQLVTTLGLIPGDVNTLINNNFKEAADAASSVKTKATEAAHTYSAKFLLEHGAASLAVSNISGSLTSLTNTPYTASVTVQSGVAATALSNLANMKIPDKQFSISAATTSAVAGAVGVNAAVNAIKDKTVNINGNVAHALAGTVAVRGALAALHDRTVSVHANTGAASGALSRIAWQIASLQSKTVTITTVHRSVEARAFGGTVGAGLLGFASGGTIPGIRGGVRNGTVYGAGTAKSDSILVRLSRGEEVIQEPYASKYRGLLKRINAGGSPVIDAAFGYARGGTVDRGSRSHGGGFAGSNPVVVHIYDVDNRLIGTMDARVQAGVSDVSARELSNELGV